MAVKPGCWCPRRWGLRRSLSCRHAWLRSRPRNPPGQWARSRRGRRTRARVRRARSPSRRRSHGQPASSRHIGVAPTPRLVVAKARSRRTPSGGAVRDCGGPGQRRCFRGQRGTALRCGPANAAARAGQRRLRRCGRRTGSRAEGWSGGLEVSDTPHRALFSGCPRRVGCARGRPELTRREPPGWLF